MTNWTKEQQKEHRKLWIKALRSDEYKQTTGALEIYGCYCCLGVACIVAMLNGLSINHEIDPLFWLRLLCRRV